MEHLDYFLGRPCTIFTHTISRNFKPEQHIHYFTGIVDEVGEYGIFIRQPARGLRTFVSTTGLVAIAEEEILDPEDPEDAKHIKAHLAANPQSLPVIEAIDSNSSIDADKLTAHLNQMEHLLGQKS